MANLTRRGVIYDFTKSPYKQNVKYDDIELTFVFSSKLYLDKFNTRLILNRNKINDSISARFGIKIENNLLCDIKLYTIIEKRGFLILDGQKEYKCLNTIKLDGNKVTLMNFQEL